MAADTLDAELAVPVREQALWEAARRGDAAARDRLIESYLPLAQILAAKLYACRTGSDLEFAEYKQFATVGLLEAVDRFDPARAVQFKTFAESRIRGAVLNGLDTLSEKRDQIFAARSLNAERRAAGRDALEQPEQDLFQQLADIAVGFALGYLLDDDVAGQHDDATELTGSHYAGIELRQLQDKVRALVERLPPRERLVIKYHYLNSVPFHVIADSMGLTRGRISQLHSRALRLLHEAVKSIKACDVAW